MDHIATVINFCSNDYRFIDRSIAEARKFSSSIVVSVCDHFFDGTPENRALLNKIYASYPDVHFVQFKWNEKRLYTPFYDWPLDEETRLCLWHSTARFAACHFIPRDAEFVLFLDADEIAEGDRLASWLQTSDLSYNAFWFMAETYRFSACERRREKQYGPLMIRKRAMTRDLVLNTQERYGLLQSITGALYLKGFEDRPFFHHYSWVRTKEENLLKVRRWAKRWQQNWEEKLQNAWENNQFLDDAPFDRVEPFFDPLSVPKIKKSIVRKSKNVTKVNDRALFRRSVEELMCN